MHLRERSATPNDVQAGSKSDDTELVVTQGDANRCGWLRANDRSMMLKLALRGLSQETQTKWVEALQSRSGAARIEVALRYEDGEPLVAGRKGPTQRVRLIKLNAGVNCPPEDVAMLWTHTLTLECRDGVRRLIEDPTTLPIDKFFRFSTGPGEVRIEFKLGTNITSRQHSGRRFRFVASSWCGDEPTIVARSESFVLVSRHPGCGKPALSGVDSLLKAADCGRGRVKPTAKRRRSVGPPPPVEPLDLPFKRPRKTRPVPPSPPPPPPVEPLEPPVDYIDPNQLIDIDQFLSWFTCPHKP